MRDEVSAVLKEPQREKWTQLFDQFKERWLPPVPPPGDNEPKSPVLYSRRQLHEKVDLEVLWQLEGDSACRWNSRTIFDKRWTLKARR